MPGMTDIETISALLDRAGIAYTVAPNDHSTIDPGTTLLTVTAKTGPRNLGYIDFESTLGFDENGALISWGCWE